MSATKQPYADPPGTHRPIPRPTALSIPYWEACKRGELTYMECQDCGLPFFPPESACIRCQSENIAWKRSAGLATVDTYTVLHREPSERFPLPTVLTILDMDEGYTIFSDIVDCDPADVRIGMRVEVLFLEIGDGFMLPLFRPAGDS